MSVKDSLYTVYSRSNDKEETLISKTSKIMKHAYGNQISMFSMVLSLYLCACNGPVSLSVLLALRTPRAASTSSPLSL